MSSNSPRSALTPEDVRLVSPALANYTQASVSGDLWKRPDLSPRDRAIVTAAALISRNQIIGMLHYFNLALDNGVAASELSEIVTHLAFYSGWPNAFSAVSILKDIFAQRGNRRSPTSRSLASASSNRGGGRITTRHHG